MYYFLTLKRWLYLFVARSTHSSVCWPASDCKFYSDEAYNHPRSCRLSASWVPNWWPPWNPSKIKAILYQRFSGRGINWVPVWWRIFVPLIAPLVSAAHKVCICRLADLRVNRRPNKRSRLNLAPPVFSEAIKTIRLDSNLIVFILNVSDLIVFILNVSNH